MLKNLFFFTSGATCAFVGSYYCLQRDVYSTSAVFIQRLDEVYSQISNIAVESRLVESRSQEISRELDIISDKKNKEIEELKRQVFANVQEQTERQERINAWIVEHLQKIDSRTGDLVNVLVSENPKLGEALAKKEQEKEDEDSSL